MEMRDPVSAQSSAEETTPTPAPTNVETDENIDARIEQAGDLDPEQAAEAEMTEGMADAEAEHLTADAVMELARELLAKDAADITTDDIRRLRQQFNLVHKVSEAADAENESADEDSTADEFKALLTQIREKKAEHVAKIEAEQLANLERKRAIIDEIIALAEDTDNVNRTFPRYRELQDEFNAIGDVPPTEDTAIWKRFQEARERYSDNLKINKELRDYDFKKNLDSKNLLLAEAEALVGEEDVITAYRRLQELHNKWRQIGPVAKEFRDEIWDKFKAASAEVNKRYQAFFEARKAREAENEAGKTALCERLEAIDIDGLRSFAAWDEATKTVMAIQQEWRSFGFASRKMNKALFARFRELCDKFFAAKAEYFRQTREEQGSNLARKTALAERAEALKDSTDWKAATDEFVAMQKEWKTIGAVAKKHSDAIWQRFLSACDYFFDRKKKAGSGARKVENDNLRAKREVIAALDGITADMPREEAIAKMRELQERWKEIGHVPFREKDKIYEAFRTRLDEVRSMLNVRESRARMERFTESIGKMEGDDQKLYRERERLMRTLEGRRQELRTYENNMGFLSSRSKSGDSMVREFERKAERLKEDIAGLENQIKLIDSKLK
ncbi:MAG: DUF349 domain-containing protein [Bacteroidales bacterium]|nr:DUF349 domain-containing protein [Bacteroidales bacterium]